MEFLFVNPSGLWNIFIFIALFSDLYERTKKYEKKLIILGSCRRQTNCEKPRPLSNVWTKRNFSRTVLLYIQIRFFFVVSKNAFTPPRLQKLVLVCSSFVRNGHKTPLERFTVSRVRRHFPRFPLSGYVVLHCQTVVGKILHDNPKTSYAQCVRAYFFFSNRNPTLMNPNYPNIFSIIYNVVHWTFD